MKYVLFDLDGTLLPMDQDYFTVRFFETLANYMEKRGYERKTFQKALLAGITAEKNNNGKTLNGTLFYEAITEYLGESFLQDKDYFDNFNFTEFNDVKQYVGFTPRAAETVKKVKAAGAKLILASNPIFADEGQKARMRWAGVDPDDFDYITSAENSTYCKPKTEYYQEILTKIGAKPQNCVMIGNDTGDDPPSINAGIQFFLLTDCLINTKNIDLNTFINGNYDALNAYLDDFLG